MTRNLSNLVQPDMPGIIKYHSLYFKAPDDILERIWTMYKHNKRCKLAERKRFDSEVGSRLLFTN